MLETADDDTVCAFLGAIVLLPEPLNVQLRPYDASVESRLIREPLNIVGGVGVDVLKSAGELVVETLDEGSNAAGDLEGLARRNGG